MIKAARIARQAKRNTMNGMQHPAIVAPVPTTKRLSVVHHKHLHTRNPVDAEQPLDESEVLALPELILQIGLIEMVPGTDDALMHHSQFINWHTLRPCRADIIQWLHDKQQHEGTNDAYSCLPHARIRVLMHDFNEQLGQHHTLAAQSDFRIKYQLDYIKMRLYMKNADNLALKQDQRRHLAEKHSFFMQSFDNLNASLREMEADMLMMDRKFPELHQ